jgi:cytochrome c
MGTGHAVGPGLAGVFGRTAGTAPDYAYSDAILASGIVWDAETMDQWLADPDGLIPGSNMVIDPIASDEERAALIAWMQSNGG